MLSKEVSSAIFKVFGMTRPGIERRSPGSLAYTLATRPYRLLLPGTLPGYILYRYRAAFAKICEGVHWSMLHMSSSLLLQQCPACLIRLTWIVFVMDGNWPYSCCTVLPLWSVQLSSQHFWVIAVKLFLHTFN